MRLLAISELEPQGRFEKEESLLIAALPGGNQPGTPVATEAVHLAPGFLPRL